MRKERVTVYVDNFKIVGSVKLKEGFRVTDYLNQLKDKFILITDAKIFDREGTFLKEESFVCVNSDTISVVLGAD